MEQVLEGLANRFTAMDWMLGIKQELKSFSFWSFLARILCGKKVKNDCLSNTASWRVSDLSYNKSRCSHTQEFIIPRVHNNDWGGFARVKLEAGALSSQHTQIEGNFCIMDENKLIHQKKTTKHNVLIILPGKHGVDFREVTHFNTHTLSLQSRILKTWGQLSSPKLSDTIETCVSVYIYVCIHTCRL